MTSSEKDKAIFRDLLVKSMDGQLAEEQIGQFNTLLSTYPDLEEYYIKCIQLQFVLRETRIFNDFKIGDLPDYKNQALWTALADAEKDSPIVEIAAPEEPKVLIQKVQHQKLDRQISKGSLFTLFAAAAAIVLILIFIRFAPPETGIKVAVLSDSVNADWADSNGTMENGTSILTSRNTLFLRKGYAKLLFTNQAQVTLEGPAEFQVLAEDRINLQCGKLYAKIPSEAIGFMVMTQSAKVIDLGTEFGVEADADGDTYLHVVKGRTTLIAGQKANKVSTEVRKGIAKKVSADTQIVSDITFRDDIFVRNIDSEKNFIWKGQREFNLADIVGGGNGFGTGRIGAGLSSFRSQMSAGRQGTNTIGKPGYFAWPEHAFVDGIFVPNAKEGPVQISSKGHLFKECPQTCGEFYDTIRNGGMVKKRDGSEGYMELKGQRCGTLENPVLYMHSNAGITFDLDNIRNAMPGVDVEGFRAVCGISTTPDSFKESKADVFVLIDGKLKTTASLTKDDSTAVDIDIKLNKSDRFLTLVSTDGGNGIGSDWVMFTKPYLFLKSSE